MSGNQKLLESRVKEFCKFIISKQGWWVSNDEFDQEFFPIGDLARKYLIDHNYAGIANSAAQGYSMIALTVKGEEAATSQLVKGISVPVIDREVGVKDIPLTFADTSPYTKLFELRDRSTFIPIIGFRTISDNTQECYLIGRSGYNPSHPQVLLTCLTGGRNAFWDPLDWGDRTFKIAHQYIRDNWDLLPHGAVIDVQFILGETTEPKVSESLSKTW